MIKKEHIKKIRNSFSILYMILIILFFIGVSIVIEIWNIEIVRDIVEKYDLIYAIKKYPVIASIVIVIAFVTISLGCKELIIKIRLINIEKMLLYVKVSQIIDRFLVSLITFCLLIIGVMIVITLTLVDTRTTFFYDIIVLSFHISFAIFILKFIISQSNLYRSYIEEKSLANRNVDFNKLNDEPINFKTDDELNSYVMVEELTHAITSAITSKLNVIGLIGGWGRGKTSIINMTKEYIDDNIENIDFSVFETWAYQTEESLFEGFEQHLLSVIKGDKRSFFLTRNLSSYSKIIFRYAEKKYGISLSDALQKPKNFQKLKIKINDSIAKHHKSIVIVFDDFDRLDNEHCVFLLKALNSLINFENVVYVLSYDEVRMNKLLQNSSSLDSGFIDKVVTSKIVLPSIDTTKFVDRNYCILNELIEQIYSTPYYDNRITKLISIISNDLENIRERKRFIIFLTPLLEYVDELDLDLCDFIGIKYLQFKYNEIYNSVKQVITFHLSTHKYHSAEYYKNIFTEEPDIYNMLKSKDVFIYNTVADNICTLIFKNGCINDYESRLINKYISNIRYFMLYYTHSDNDFTKLQEDVHDSMKTSDFDELKSKRTVHDIINKYDYVNNINMKFYLQHYILMLMAILSNEIKNIDKQEKFDVSNGDKIDRIIIALYQVTLNEHYYRSIKYFEDINEDLYIWLSSIVSNYFEKNYSQSLVDVFMVERVYPRLSRDIYFLSKIYNNLQSSQNKMKILEMDVIRHINSVDSDGESILTQENITDIIRFFGKNSDLILDNYDSIESESAIEKLTIGFAENFKNRLYMDTTPQSYYYKNILAVCSKRNEIIGEVIKKVSNDKAAVDKIAKWTTECLDDTELASAICYLKDIDERFEYFVGELNNYNDLKKYK